MWRSVIWALAVLASVACLYATGCSAERASEPVSTHVELALSGDLAGDGHILRVEFYHRGPFQPSTPGQPPEYVRGLAVSDPKVSPGLLARWESERTTIRAFYPELNRLWSVRVPGGVIITTVVQWGGRTSNLYTFRWENGRLEQVRAWGGEDFKIQRMGGKLVVVVTPSDYSKLPELYAWDGKTFAEAGRRFPKYYAKLGIRYVRGIRQSEPLPPEAVIQSCRLALQAFELAGQPDVACKACLEARDRISSGQNVTFGVAVTTTEQLRRYKDYSLSEIEKLMAASCARLPEGR